MQDINISAVLCHHEKQFNMPVFLLYAQIIIEPASHRQTYAYSNKVKGYNKK